MGAGARRSALVAAAVAALGVPAAVVGVLAARDGNDSAAGPCEVSELPSQGEAHVSEEEPGFQYNSYPPTSGPSASEPVPWSLYDTPRAQARLVHNLSHGGVVVQYGDEVPPADVARIAGWYRSDPDGIIVAPLAGLGDRIALTAWTHLAVCSRFDAAAFSAFRDARRFQGPERLEREALRPQKPEAARPLVSDLSLWPRPFADTLSITVTLEQEAASRSRSPPSPGGSSAASSRTSRERRGRLRRLGSPRRAGTGEPAGVYVVRVEAVTPAERAGLTAPAEAV